MRGRTVTLYMGTSYFVNRIGCGGGVVRGWGVCGGGGCGGEVGVGGVDDYRGYYDPVFTKLPFTKFSYIMLTASTQVFFVVRKWSIAQA